MANVFNLTGGGGGGTGIQLKSIKVTKLPQTEYKVGESFKTDNMEVTATYSNDATKVVTGYTYQPSGTLREQDTTITITYAEDGKTASTTVTIHVTRTEIPVPTQNGTLTYDGTPKTVGWNNYDHDKMTISGNQTETEAGTYTVTFTPKEAYCWPLNDTESKQVQWVITQAQGSITLVPSEVTLSPTHSSETVTITKKGDGDISIDNKFTSLINASLNDAHNLITITSVNNSSGQASITVTLATGKNYLGTSVTLNVSAAFWEWGNETEVGDEAWWAGLKSWIATASTEDLLKCLGKTKKVHMNATVLGTTEWLAMCVGWNCDRDKNAVSTNTLTFHSKNCFVTNTAFDTSNGKWTGSTVRKLCQDVYNTLPFKASVATVSKGTATAINRNQNGTPSYQEETVFLPSDCEMGFPSGKDYSNGKGYAASYTEFCEQNTQHIAYLYYTDNASRIKKNGDSGSSNQYYWERSLYYYSEGSACIVYSDGKPGNYNYYGSYGLAPAFVI